MIVGVAVEAVGVIVPAEGQGGAGAVGDALLGQKAGTVRALMLDGDEAILRLNGQLAIKVIGGGAGSDIIVCTIAYFQAVKYHIADADGGVVLVHKALGHSGLDLFQRKFAGVGDFHIAQCIPAVGVKSQVLQLVIGHALDLSIDINRGGLGAGSEATAAGVLGQCTGGQQRKQRAQGQQQSR